ncbi:Helix-turn-helix motif-containing protein [Cynara cardunculus var. scolymus]|uniref:Homeobox-leucine zipper protein n=1 Tax=Cynara cardunculus var. scolymus TaxID=59895 RepID=A0A103Y604_CYNCS|nr:Helix-turn-helix motif-containing protein [Cynara cardunculus var. scolymus]
MEKKDGGNGHSLNPSSLSSFKPPPFAAMEVVSNIGSSESMAGLMPMCSTIEEGGNSPVGYTREFQSMLMEGLDEDGGGEESAGGQISEKKRRLSVDQVKALEKNFEMENKLEPERKVKLAQELGLQPRQVAVWFQNRRARWKTKQLERDYGVLKANFDSLKNNYESLKHDNESLLKQIRELKSKLYGEDEETHVPVKEETGDKPKSPEMMYENMTTYFKDGSSDSDSSAILNEDNNSSNMAAAIVMNCQQLPESKAIMGDAQKAYQPQFVKIEEHNFFSGDESCNFFSDDQAPTLQWYCQDQWNLTEDN